MKIFTPFSKGVFSLFFFTILFTISVTGQNKLLFDGTKPGIEISVLSSNSSSTILEYKLTGMFEDEIEINGKTYISLSAPKMISLKEKGFPELPITRNSIIISDDEGIKYKILEQEFEYRNTLPVAPSKGHFTRDIDPKNVEYTFDDFYGEDKWFPEKILTVDSPYIVRDFRGATVQFNPVQFNPQRNKLKIYTHLIVEIINDSEREAVNPLDGKSYEISKGYESVYKSLFLNYPERSTEYTELPENGRLLIVYYQDYAAQVAAYYNWKVSSGFNVVLAEYPTDTGSGSSSLQTYIQNLYDEPESLMFIVLIGENDEVPTLSGDYEGAPSDPCYVKLAGADAYPDAYISRISVDSPDNCEYVLHKIMNYGASAKAANDWLTRGMGVASDQGTPPDWERADSLRAMLINNMNFTLVDQIYDPTGTATEVTNAINDGRSVINYIGHGSGVSWSTTGFGVSNINNLSNGYKLPFVIDVACVNGDFTLGECMEEAWIRAGDLNDPKGAIAAYGSSTNASWVPPCDMQNHAVELMTTYQKITVGGVCFNGLMYAMDLWGGSDGEGLKLMEQYNIFGDCSTYLIFGATPDDVPPTTITDLDVTDFGSNSYKLIWTAPNDTSMNGVTAYDVRKSSSPINTENDFYAAEQISCGAPSSPGANETLQIDNLPCNDTKYYAIKALDMWGNASEISNVVEAETYGPPEITVTPALLEYPAVEVGTSFTDIIQIENTSANLSTLDYT
ncbi:MAG: hypothetical protein GXO87_13210, partial [Chlorobi bacterium]|nr:hypothetical protein [Chlorobiota bacterium]